MSDKNNKTLKPGWRRVKFGEVVRLSKARSQDPLADGIERYVGLEHLEPGDLRIRNWGNVADGVTFTSVFQPGQVLFGKRRAYQRKVAVADFSGVCSGDIYVLETKDAKVLLPELLPFICQTDAFFDHAVGTSAGSLSPRTNWTSLADFEFVLPSLEAQTQILAVLSRYTELDDEYSSANRCALDLLSSHAHSVFANRNYDLVPFEKVLTRQPQSGVYKAQEFLGRGTKIVNMGELFGFDEIVDSIDMKRMELTLEEISKYKLTPDDLLFGRRSIVLEGAGKCSMVGGLEEPVIFESSIIRVTVNTEIVVPQFIFEWLRSPKGTQQITRIRSFTTVAGIAGSDLKRIVVPVMPIKEQIAISDELSSMRASVSAIADRQTANRILRKTILKETLGGGDVH
ncbi:MAG: restriction endonuclease [Cupriavidus sp.]|nr:restriction endonuclease [Cupriavidus sp.]